MQDTMQDKGLKQRVENALEWDPSIDQSDIGVSVENGVVTLRGNVPSYAQRAMAERVVLRVYGTKAVANDLDVRLGADGARTDTDIAQAAVAALTWNTVVPRNCITVAVDNGRIALGGTVEWQFQKDAAAGALRNLAGVRGISNEVMVRPRISTADLRAKIEAAFTRSAEIDARRINVSAQDGKVILSGNVRSWAERQEAERAAWAAPGVTQVDDRLSITP
jgi:osmotically-inducible protein OsmY